MEHFLDLYWQSLNRFGEELCGDRVKIQRTPERTILVLSDGLGSGVKANILATLTSTILVTMLRAAAPLQEVIETVVGTLPICQTRKIAYATFTILELDHASSAFRVINFDNPAPVLFRRGQTVPLEMRLEEVSGKQVGLAEGRFEKGDFLSLISDGTLYAGLGETMAFGWGRENIARFIEEQFSRPVYAAHSIVNAMLAKTRQLYEHKPGDDATVVGVLVRERKSLLVFTGPPLDESHDYLYVDRLLDFPGRKVICGGTTANIVSAFLKKPVETVIGTMREDIPPVGQLEGIDLVTEGILTLSAALELIGQSGGALERLAPDHNGAYLLTRELLLADSITFQVGQKINPYYQNPLLPKNISIRRTLVEQLATALEGLNKEVQIAYC